MVLPITQDIRGISCAFQEKIKTNITYPRITAVIPLTNPCLVAFALVNNFLLSK